MRIASVTECRAYVAAELGRVLGRVPGWDAGATTSETPPSLRWTLRYAEPGTTGSTGWFTLEAQVDRKEFLVWFGHHQVGAPGLHWIMRPAVHIAFEDLEPRADPIGLPYSLGDVLECMMHSAQTPQPAMQTRFDLNDFSLT